MLDFKLESWLYFRQSLSWISYFCLISATFCIFLIVPRSHPLYINGSTHEIASALNVVGVK